MRKGLHFPGRYILIGQTPVAEPDILAWAEWFETADRVVEQTEVGGYFVSTIFLALDHDLRGLGPPLLFETMVFSDQASIACKRCSTWTEAEALHRQVCAEFARNLRRPHHAKSKTITDLRRH
jgi:hypothetical protein